MGNRDLSDKTVYIYTLADPRTDVVRYIGYTSNLKGRFGRHLKSEGESHKDRWVRSLLREGIQPVMEVLEKCLPGEDYQAKEVSWIAAYRAIGFELTNETDGGDGASIGNQNLLGHVHTEETIEKIREANKGRVLHPPFSDETLEKMSVAKKGKKLSPEHCKALGIAQQGRKHSPETIEKIRVANTGKVRTPETLAKQSVAHKGKKHTEETRAKMGVSRKGHVAWNKGVPHSPEHREKIRVAGVGRKHTKETTEKIRSANTGKKHTPEAVEKIRIAKRAWWVLHRVQQQILDLVDQAREERNDDAR